MRIFFTLLPILFLHFSLLSQTLAVGGQCMSGTITLNKIADIGGRAAYQGTGTVDGTSGVTVSVYWMPSPDNLWVLDFDGQPYYSNACNTAEPPGTANGSCSWTAVDGTSCTGATALFLSASPALPVELVSFLAQKNNGAVELKWITASEQNNKGFEVQRSGNAVDWTVIGFVHGAGTSSVENNYGFTDKQAPGGKTYYRLLQIDLDGRRKFSNTVTVDLGHKSFYSIADNPGNGQFKIAIRTQEKVELTVLDQNGRRLMNKPAVAGVEEIDLRSLPAGIYLLQLKRGKEIYSEKLIKQ
jgi:hypothetical protein